MTDHCYTLCNYRILRYPIRAIGISETELAADLHKQIFVAKKLLHPRARRSYRMINSVVRLKNFMQS